MIGGPRVEGAWQLLAAGDIAGARRAGEACLAAPSEPGEIASAHLILAACSRKEGDSGAMVAHATAATAVAPGNALTHYALAESVDAAGDKPRAIAALTRAL
ncbi:MAG: hypothetical protein E6H67_19240, partial [Betaproteobacteria bacterium]